MAPGRSDLLSAAPAFADRYRFRPLATWPGQTHGKGLVERPTGCVKDSFWYGRRFTGLEDPQPQGNRWRDMVCNVRTHAGLDGLPVDRFKLERAQLLPLPEEPFRTEEILFAKVSRWRCVSLDSNNYSVPLLLVGARLGARLSTTEVRLFHQAVPIASRPRCYGRHQVITQPGDPNRPWAVRPSAPRLRAQEVVPGLGLPPEAMHAVQQRDLAVYDPLIGEALPARPGPPTVTPRALSHSLS